MTKKKKIIYASVTTLLVLLLVAFFSINMALDRVSRKAMAQLAQEAEQRGVEIKLPDFGSVWLSGFLSATWSDVSAVVNLQTGEMKDRRRMWDMHIDRATIDWDLNNQGTLVAQGIKFVRNSNQPDEEELANRSIELNQVDLQFPLELQDPRAVIKSLLPEFVRLTEDGTTSLPLGIEGVIAITFKNQPIQLHLRTIRQGDDTVVVLNRDDVAALAPLFKGKLTDAEADLIAMHPRRAPRLLDIKDSAETSSAQAHQDDATVPQDAYRHVLWSFLLTRVYGADFAKLVGEAHETGDTGNTAAERKMDLHNNAIGRKYAEQEIPRSGVLKRLLADTDVQHFPEDSSEEP